MTERTPVRPKRPGEDEAMNRSRVCQKLAFIATASASGMKYTLYMKVALPVLPTAATYPLFEDTSRLLSDSIDALTPEGHAPALSESSSRAAQALGIPVALGSEFGEVPLSLRSRRSSGGARESSVVSSQPRISVANFHISILAPGVSENELSGSAGADKLLYLVTLNLESPIVQRPPEWPFKVRCPIPFCLNSSLKISLDDSAIAATSYDTENIDAEHSVVIDVQPTLLSKDRLSVTGVTTSANDDESDSDDEEAEVEQFTVQGRFQSADAVIVRWANSAAGYSASTLDDLAPLHAKKMVSNLTVSLQEPSQAGENTVNLHYDWSGVLEGVFFPSLQTSAIMSLNFDGFQQEAGWKELAVTCTCGHVRRHMSHSADSLHLARGHDGSLSSGSSSSMVRLLSAHNGSHPYPGDDTSIFNDTLDDTDENLYLSRLPRALKHTASDSSFDQRAPLHEPDGLPSDPEGNVVLIIDVNAVCGRGETPTAQQCRTRLHGVVAVRTQILPGANEQEDSVLETFAIPILRASSAIRSHECTVRILTSGHGVLELVRTPHSAFAVDGGSHSGAHTRSDSVSQSFTFKAGHLALTSHAPLPGHGFDSDAGVLLIRRPRYKHATTRASELLHEDAGSYSVETAVPGNVDGTPIIHELELSSHTNTALDATSSSTLQDSRDQLHVAVPASFGAGVIAAATLEVWPFLTHDAHDSKGKAMHKLACTWPCVAVGSSQPVSSLLFALGTSVDIIHVLIGGVQQPFDLRADPALDLIEDVSNQQRGETSAVLVELPASTQESKQQMFLQVEILFRSHPHSLDPANGFALFTPTFASSVDDYTVKIHWPQDAGLRIDHVPADVWDHIASDSSARLTILRNFQLTANSRRTIGPSALLCRTPPLPQRWTRTSSGCIILLPILAMFLYTSLVCAGLFHSLATPMQTISHRVDVLARALNIDFSEDLYGQPHQHQYRSAPSQVPYIRGLEHLHDTLLRSERDQEWEEGVLQRTPARDLAVEGDDSNVVVENDFITSQAIEPAGAGVLSKDVYQPHALTRMLRHTSLPLVWTLKGASAFGRILLRILFLG